MWTGKKKQRSEKRRGVSEWIERNTKGGERKAQKKEQDRKAWERFGPGISSSGQFDIGINTGRKSEFRFQILSSLNLSKANERVDFSGVRFLLCSSCLWFPSTLCVFPYSFWFHGIESSVREREEREETVPAVMGVLTNEKKEAKKKVGVVIESRRSWDLQTVNSERKEERET